MVCCIELRGIMECKFCMTLLCEGRLGVPLRTRFIFIPIRMSNKSISTLHQNQLNFPQTQHKKDHKSRIDFTSDLPSTSWNRLSTVLYQNVDSLYQIVGGKSIVDFTDDSTRFCCCFETSITCYCSFFIVCRDAKQAMAHITSTLTSAIN